MHQTAPQAGSPPADVLELDACVVDLVHQRVLRADDVLPLTTREVELLRYLGARPNVDVSTERLLREVWGYARPPETRAVALVVSRLRRKIEADPELPRNLLTVTGTGYRFAPRTRAPVRPEAAEGAPGPVLLCALDAARVGRLLPLAEALGRRGVPFVLDQASLAEARPSPALETASVLVWVAPEGALPELARALLRITEARRLRSGLPVIVPLGADGGLLDLGPTCPGTLPLEADPEGLASWLELLRARPRPPWPLPMIAASRQQPGVDAALQQIQPAGAPYDPRWHAPWPELEREARRSLAVPGAPVVILGARSAGKTWLLQHLLAGAEGSVVSLDLAELGRARGTATVLPWMAEQIADQLRLEVELPDLGPSSPLPPRRALDRWLEREVLPQVPSTLWLALDGADQLRQVPGDDAVFQMLRALATRARPPWDRLRLLLTISTEPALLMDRPELSPFNLTPPLRLGDLGPDALIDLARRHGLADPEGAAASLRAWVGGQPYLVRLGLGAMAGQGLSLESVVEQGLSGEGPWGDHLRALLLRLRESPVACEALSRLLREPDAPLELSLGHRLCEGGVLVARAGGWRFRCPLYARFLAAHL